MSEWEFNHETIQTTHVVQIRKCITACRVSEHIRIISKEQNDTNTFRMLM